jgi:hypothetical protein
MLVEYKITDSEYMILLQQGVVLHGMFQLFDLERNKEWNKYPDFEAIPNPKYAPKYDVTTNTTYDDDKELYRGSYGVCDSLQNLLDIYPELEATGEGSRKFVVNMCGIAKEDQHPDGGWRWHKWGAYIGAETPTCEYLYDEPVIEQVYCYHIYEKVA